jgi:hypothetical protein
MYPLPDPVLCLCDIARHWAREPGSMPETEILDRLLSAFWTGELVANFSAAQPAAPRTEQMRLLQAAAGFAEHPGLLFLGRDEAAPPVVVEAPDGGIFADRRIRVVWPPASGTESARFEDDAFQLLAQAVVADYAADLRPVLELLETTRSDFDAYRRGQGWPPPKFWFGKSERLTPAAAAARCKRWLQALARRGPKPCSKPELQATAISLFPGLSARAFERVWEVVPDEWRRAGAPSKRSP